MNPTKRVEAIDMLKTGPVMVQIIEDGVMSDEIECTHLEEIEALVSVHGAENVYF